MLQNEKISCFTELGKFLGQFNYESYSKNATVFHNDNFYERMVKLIEELPHINGWFTKENVCYSLQTWSKALTKENLSNWLQPYTIKENSNKTVAVIMAGNIPLVGFHDFLSVLLSGNRIVIKMSSNDRHLLNLVIEYLCALNSNFKDFISVSDDKLQDYDAVIATGSNNTSRYFEYYFKDKPHIIRKNRNSVAVLFGDETKDDLFNLGKDIFTYFGLGCRNVSKIFVPKNYNFDFFFNAIYPYKYLIEYKKYANNYDYNKAVYLMSLFPILDNGFFTLKEDMGYSSPISSVFYEYYEDENELYEKLNKDKEMIQCIVSNKKNNNFIPFGKSQEPELYDYADGIDTLSFLTKL